MNRLIESGMTVLLSPLWAPIWFGATMIALTQGYVFEHAVSEGERMAEAVHLQRELNAPERNAR